MENKIIKSDISSLSREEAILMLRQIKTVVDGILTKADVYAEFDDVDDNCRDEGIATGLRIAAEDIIAIFDKQD